MALLNGPFPGPCRKLPYAVSPQAPSDYGSREGSLTLFGFFDNFCLSFYAASSSILISPFHFLNRFSLVCKYLCIVPHCGKMPAGAAVIKCRRAASFLCFLLINVFDNDILVFQFSLPFWNNQSIRLSPSSSWARSLIAVHFSRFLRIP